MSSPSLVPAANSSEFQARNAILSRDRLSHLETRLDHLERAACSNTYVLRGFPKLDGESNLLTVIRVLRDVLSVETTGDGILNCIATGYDPKVNASSLRFSVSMPLHDRIRMQLQSKERILQQYNKARGAGIQLFRALSYNQLSQFNTAKRVATLLKQKEPGLVVSVSSENFRIRIGERGGKWESLSSIAERYAYVASALNDMGQAPNNRKRAAMEGIGGDQEKNKKNKPSES